MCKAIIAYITQVLQVGYIIRECKVLWHKNTGRYVYGLNRKSVNIYCSEMIALSRKPSRSNFTIGIPSYRRNVRIGDRNPLPQKKCKNRGSEFPPTDLNFENRNEIIENHILKTSSQYGCSLINNP